MGPPGQGHALSDLTTEIHCLGSRGQTPKAKVLAELVPSDAVWGESVRSPSPGCGGLAGNFGILWCESITPVPICLSDAVPVRVRAPSPISMRTPARLGQGPSLPRCGLVLINCICNGPFSK